MRLDADESGDVRFHVRAPHGSHAITMHLDCTAEEGGTTRHSVEIRGDPRHNPAPKPEEGAASHASARAIPSLEGDPLAATNRELISRGYPPRPDPAARPAHYARWLKKVSRPTTRVNPKKTGHSEVSFARAKNRAEVLSPTLPLPPPRKSRIEIFAPTLPLPPPLMRPMFNSNSTTWSGAQLTNPVGQFFWIEAEWRVPGVAALPGGPGYSAVAEWVGLDNSGTDLFQSGTDSECWNIDFFGPSWTFTNYWMWIEDLPWDPWGLPNFPLSPGDEVSVDIFLADQFGTTWFQNQDEGNGGLTPADNNVWFMIYNLTQGLSFWGTLPAGANSFGGRTSTGYTGNSAEFIIERPTDTGSGNPYPLAAFFIAEMQGCWYGDSEYGTRGWQLLPAGSTPFDATLTYLNMTNTSGGTLALPLTFPDPSSPGGAEILWLWFNYS
jgi:hypothetical protein